MAKPLSKEEVIQRKKKSIKELNALLEQYINDSSGKHLKKANLISYWLSSYTTYLAREETFDPKKLIAYKRGDIIKADFGFNVGSEHGGLHYAVVIDVYNRQGSPVVTVIPLSSGSESSTYERDVYLGNELYSKVTAKTKLLLDTAREKLENVNRILEVLKQSTADNAELISEDFIQQYDDVQKDIEVLEKYKRETDNMKQGSIAMMEQVTTISKMRIYVPRKSQDILYGISFSSSAMDKIDAQLKKLFFFDASKTLS